MNQQTNKKPWVLLCIPVFLAALFLWQFTSSLTAEKVTLSSPVTGESEFTSPEDLRFFAELLKNAPPVEEAARPLEEYQSLTLTVVEATKSESRYTLLLSGSPADCLFTDGSSALHRIRPEHAQTLLMKEPLQYVNPNYSLPTLSVSAGGKELSLSEAQSIQWTYRLADESYRSRSTEGTSQTTFVLPREESPSFQFSRAPHWSNVIVTKGEKELYNGSAEDFSSFVYDGDGDLTVRLQAKWNQKEGCGYYGESLVSFTLRCDAPAHFAISAESCYPGDPIAILAKNCLNGGVSVSSTLPGAESAKDVLYNGEKLILLPVSLQTKPGTYTLEVQGEGQTQSFTLTVNERSNNTEELTNLSISQLVSAFEEEDAFLRELTSTPNMELLWNQDFSLPISEEDPAKCWMANGFGYSILVDGTPTKLLHSGLDYVSLIDTPIEAVNDGVVVFAGELAYSGKTVVIDHGLGIYSVYGYLNYISVNEGDSVYLSQTIGTLGNSGFAGGTCLHFEMRMLGECVTPELFIKAQELFLDFNF